MGYEPRGRDRLDQEYGAQAASDEGGGTSRTGRGQRLADRDRECGEGGVAGLRRRDWPPGDAADHGRAGLRVVWAAWQAQPRAARVPPRARGRERHPGRPPHPDPTAAGARCRPLTRVSRARLRALRRDRAARDDSAGAHARRPLHPPLPGGTRAGRRSPASSCRPPSTHWRSCSLRRSPNSTWSR